VKEPRAMWLWEEEVGLTAVEYALLLALMVIAGLVVWTELGRTLIDAWWTASNHMEVLSTPTP